MRFVLGAALTSITLSLLSATPIAAYGAGTEAREDNPSVSSEDYFSGRCVYGRTYCKNGLRIYPTPGYDPAGADWCWYDSHVRICIKWEGDYVYVKDKVSDGRSAVAEVYGPVSTWEPRSLYCRNPYGTGTWARCNFDWPENNYYDLVAYTFNKENDDWITRFRAYFDN
ncbi:MAG: hypothetical protein ACRDTM_13205 [Micromonosporaceae bacterium]